MGMIDTIKKASIGAVDANKPVSILFGQVLTIGTTIIEEVKGDINYFKTKINNIEIKVDQKLMLDKDFFIIPENLTRYEIGTTENSLRKLVIREGLKKGDKVLLLRIQGGQQYVILDKVV